MVRRHSIAAASRLHLVASAAGSATNIPASSVVCAAAVIRAVNVVIAVSLVSIVSIVSIVSKYSKQV